MNRQEIANEIRIRGKSIFHHLLVISDNCILYREGDIGRKEFFEGGGGVIKGIFFQKCSFCTDFFPNTLFRKCKQFAPKKRDSFNPPHPPSPTPYAPEVCFVKCMHWSLSVSQVPSDGSGVFVQGL